MCKIIIRQIGSFATVLNAFVVIWLLSIMAIFIYSYILNTFIQTSGRIEIIIMFAACLTICMCIYLVMSIIIIFSYIFSFDFNDADQS